MKKIVSIAIFFLCANIIVTAQDESIDAKVKRHFENGTVLSSPICTYKGHSFDICTKQYDPLLLGIYYNENSEWDPSNPSRTYKIPIRTNGISYVRYNENNGIIKIGDPVTSSDVAGVAMKATESGMILGIALEDAGVSGDLLKIRLSIQYMR